MKTKLTLRLDKDIIKKPSYTLKMEENQFNCWLKSSSTA